jgi:glucose-1-phosphate adenylyltransferase
MNDRTQELARTQALILAGGQGERLQPLTVSRPKPAVSFGGIFRIIDFKLSNCLRSGLARVSLLTQYRHERLHRYIRERWSNLWNNTVQAGRSPLLLYPSTSGKRYRGTADAVFRNYELLESDDAEFVLILSGDHIYQMDYAGFLRQHTESGADLTIATVQHPIGNASHFGVVEVDGDFRVTSFEEKPANPRPLPSRPSMALVSMGVYVFNKKVLLESLRCLCETGQGYDFGHDIIPSMIHSGRTYAYDFRDDTQSSPAYWRDIGTLDGYYKASMELLDPDGLFNPYAIDGWTSQPRRHPSFSGRSMAASALCCNGDTRITRSVLSPDLELAHGVTVDESILMPGVRIGEGARVRRAIIDEGVHIPAGFHIGIDLDQDRRYHTVTDSGVVVVSKNSKGDIPGRPCTLRFGLRVRAWKRNANVNYRSAWPVNDSMKREGHRVRTETE